MFSKDYGLKKNNNNNNLKTLKTSINYFSKLFKIYLNRDPKKVKKNKLCPKSL